MHNLPRCQHSPPDGTFVAIDESDLFTADLFTVSLVLPFLDCHIVWIMQYVAFSDGLLSHSNTHLSLLQVFS